MMAARLKPPDNVTLTQRNQRKAGMNTASVGLMLVKFLSLSPPPPAPNTANLTSGAWRLLTTTSSWSLLPHYITDHEEMRWIVLLHQDAMATLTGRIYAMCAYYLLFAREN